jgi:NADPH-dependent 2,4-dienoyl-CoA reductase/sulfur reductase-like enzyme
VADQDQPGRVVIVGAATAGLSVAETLRRESFEGAITLIGEEEHLPYERPPLSKRVLSGEWPEERATLRDREKLDDLGLELRLGERAASLDPEARTVALEGGEELGYDELVVATGAAPIHLPGTEGIEGVHVLRTLEHCAALRERLADRPRVVIVGGGFLGTEIAATARGFDADVVLVSDLDEPLADVLGPELASMLTGLHAERGVDVRTGVMAEEVTADDGVATGVRLADGSTIDAGLVVVAIGARPGTGWLEGSGLDLDDGIVCDATCRAAPSVWAAGDVARWHHEGLGRSLRIEHRTNAGMQGMAVARNILAGDDATPFTPVPFIWTDQYELTFQIHGLPEDGELVEVIEGSHEDRELVVAYGNEGRVVAAVGVNSPRTVRKAQRLVADGAAWDELGSLSP